VFCADLKRRRGELGMTLDQLADRSGLTPNYIGTIENGYRDPSLSTLASLAAGLGVSLGELFGPPRPLSHPAADMARLFGEAPEDLQAAILKLLHALAKKQRP
jgi:transcriptional regulator with XRE-family HTH domain